MWVQSPPRVLNLIIMLEFVLGILVGIVLTVGTIALAYFNYFKEHKL
jgi:hypothetical protein